MTYTRFARRGAAAIVVAATALVLMGCTPVVSSNPSEGGQRQEGGTLVVAQAGDFQPGVLLGGRAGNFPWITAVLEPLIFIDPETNKPQPVLATGWEFADDGLSMTIELREGVTFHTGRAFTADDVKWTFEKALDPASGSQVGFIAKNFAAVNVTGPTSLAIDFTTPLSESTIFDFFQQSNIVDSETYDLAADGSQVVGTGPFVWSDYEPGVSLTVTKYDDYWRSDDVALEGITFERMSDSTAQLSAIRSDRAQVGYGLGLTDAKGFESDPQFSVLDAGGSIYPFGVDVTQAPFDDIRVRQALAYAIDRDRINEQVFAGAGTVTDLFWGAAVPDEVAALSDAYTYDPERATKLIEEAGATGAEVPITVVALPAIQSEYEIIANNLESIGLRPSAVSVDETTFNSLQNQANLGPAFLLIHGQVGFAESTMLNSLPPLRANNPSHYDSPEYQDLRTNFLTAQDAASSSTAFVDLTKFLLDEAWTVPIVQAPGKLIIAGNVDGIAVTKRGTLLFTDAYLTE